MSLARPPQLPASIAQSVSIYKSLYTEYSSITDPVLKAAYLTILTAKYAEISSNLSSYTSSVQAYISSLQVQS